MCITIEKENCNFVFKFVKIYKLDLKFKINYLKVKNVKENLVVCIR